ncbi:hypothetical protein GCM10029964_118560 [Kibdelosporangium lantanae]
MHDPTMPTTLTVRAEQHALWLCFEPWANEYTIPRGTTVVIHFNNESTVETTHHAVGITFFTLGRHPDIWSEDDQPLEIFSDYMPRTSTGTPEEAIRAPGYSVGSATGSANLACVPVGALWSAAPGRVRSGPRTPG